MVSALRLFTINYSPVRALPPRDRPVGVSFIAFHSEFSRVQIRHNQLIKKSRPKGRLVQNGERAGIRTQGHLIKSQVLYQLSYALIIFT